MKVTLAVVLASAYGLTLRILFDVFGDLMEVMSGSFLFLAPVIIGFLTIFLLPRQKKVSHPAAFFLPWLTSLAILVITMALSIEGAICWIMIYPFFSIAAGIGGLIARFIRDNRDKNTDNFDIMNVSVAILLPIPIVLGFAEKGSLSTTKEYTITKQVVIAASPATTWNQLVNIDQIHREEHKDWLTTSIGFPSHIKTTLDTVAVGGHRTAYFEKGLYFNETITQCQPGHLLALNIKTDPSKIPPTTMDEHILIGGKHIDVLEDVYTLEPLADGQCSLQLTSRYKICTPFNWYADLWAGLLLNDMLGGELNIIKQRATATMQASR